MEPQSAGVEVAWWRLIETTRRTPVTEQPDPHPDWREVVDPRCRLQSDLLLRGQIGAAAPTLRNSVRARRGRHGVLGEEELLREVGAGIERPPGDMAASASEVREVGELDLTRSRSALNARRNLQFRRRTTLLAPAPKERHSRRMPRSRCFRPVSGIISEHWPKRPPAEAAGRATA
jgi:hypothetical protein